MSDNPKKTAIQRALKMNDEGYKMVSIAKELGVHVATVRRWFRQAGIPPRKGDVVGTDTSVPADPLAKELEKDLEGATREAIIQATHDARLAEDTAMLSVAEAQATPADKYQHYIAAAGIKLLRDSIKNLKGPKTVKELSELDQLIRRNLGLNAKSGASRTVIDISILNNRKADRGKGSKVIDIELD